jgi:hypothetical protein
MRGAVKGVVKRGLTILEQFHPDRTRPILRLQATAVHGQAACCPTPGALNSPCPFENPQRLDGKLNIARPGSLEEGQRCVIVFRLV